MLGPWESSDRRSLDTNSPTYLPTYLSIYLPTYLSSQLQSAGSRSYRQVVRTSLLHSATNARAWRRRLAVSSFIHEGRRNSRWSAGICFRGTPCTHEERIYNSTRRCMRWYTHDTGWNLRVHSHIAACVKRGTKDRIFFVRRCRIWIRSQIK